MEKFKEELNNIHAPEDLIMKTLARVHEEEKKVEEEKTVKTDKAETLEKTETVEKVDNAVETPEVKSGFGYMDSNYTEVESKEDSEEEKTGNIRKVNFAQRYRKYIVAVSTFAAAAIILIIALNMNSMKNNLYEATAPSDNTECATEAYMEEAESADDAKTDDSESALVSGGESAAESTEASVAETQEDFSLNTAESDNKRDDSLTSDESYGSTLNINPCDEDVASFKLMSFSDYSKLIGVDVSPIKESFQLEEDTVKVSIDGDKIAYDEGIIILKGETGYDGLLLISRSNSVYPQKILNEIPTDIDGREVYIGEYSDDHICMAYFEVNGIGFFLQTEGIEREEFNTMLEKLLKCIK